MARNDRLCSAWPQPRRSTYSKSHANRRTDDLDDLGDIMSLLSSCSKNKPRKETWPIHSSNRAYQPPDCCLKNGRIHCSCLGSKNEFPMDNTKTRHNIRKTALVGDSLLSHERKRPFWHESNSAGHSGAIKMAEEYVLDDNELCFEFYDMPFDMPKQHHLRKVGKVKTVSIIDTLSELASGATDREDEGGFSSAVSESAILSYDPYRSRVKHARHSSNKRNHGWKDNSHTSSLSNEFNSKNVQRLQLNDNLSGYPESVCSSQIQNVHRDDGHFTCSSLKRTLKYLRKAVSSNVVEEEVAHPRRNIHWNEEKDAFRQCFSDSEVREVLKPWAPVRHTKPVLNSRSKSRSLLTVTSQNPTAVMPTKQADTSIPIIQSRPKADAPDWIKKVFSAVRKGEVEELKEGLKDIDSGLVRNLSDDHGNNLWHICSAQNHVHCLDWLCSHNQQQTDALKDENKHGFTPVALAVKHGSLLSVQWLIHNTNSKSQLTTTGNSRSLLHIATKYGQEATVQWLLNYMNSQEIDVNSTDREGNTALHLAAKHGHINCVKTLVFQNGNLQTRNERGLKPINLAIKYSQVNCADYLLAMESCYNLATANIKQQSELQQLQKENAETKNYFRELLTLTKRLQHRQKELVRTFTKLDQSGQFESTIVERSDKCTKYVADYTQLLAAVIADEENRLLLVEERWKKSRKPPKSSDSRKLPLDIIRTQFTHILDKVSDQNPAIPSTPETSDDSWQSGEDDTLSLPLGGSASNITGLTPDVIHTHPTQKSSCLDSKNKKSIIDSAASVSSKEVEINPKDIVTDVPIQRKMSVTPKSNPAHTVSGSARDVNLQVFFKQNPNLRQTSETCSVLEVLEPSSSDSDECINKRHSKKINNDEVIQSSSSSATETLSPSSCGPSSTESKKSGSRSSSNGSKHNVNRSKGCNNTNIHSSVNATNTVQGSCSSKGHENTESNNDSLHRNISYGGNFENANLMEPDLIKGTQKKKRTGTVSHMERELPQKESKDATSTDNPSISTEDSESLEADQSFCSIADTPESLLPGQTTLDLSVPGTGVKKKSFLLKFALRGRWPSKHSRSRSAKNEISAEEFRETYSRSAENIPTPSQGNMAGSSAIKKLSPFPAKEVDRIQDPVNLFDPNCNIARGLDNSSAFPSTSDITRTNIQHPSVTLLPPRRDPPPVPPRPPRDSDTSQIISDDNMIISSVNSSCVTSCMTESAVSLHDPYITNSSSNLWQSPDSKSLFRPASSASRVESPSRAEDSFPLNKSSSASTEMLSALDSSTAGRQSPAPSEVSKTESALSPPSDVSKTESARYLSQLGRIEESSHLAVIKASALQNPVTEEKTVADEGILKDDGNELKPKKKSSSKKHNLDKPWYEFSDEEDVITPHRYEVMSVRMRSSSEDDEIIAS